MDEEVTTQLTLTQLELDAIIIAISDSTSKCQFFADTSNAKGLVEQYVAAGVPAEEAKRIYEQQREMSSSLLETYADILVEVREIYPEVERDTQEAKKPLITIHKS